MDELAQAESQPDEHVQSLPNVRVPVFRKSGLQTGGRQDRIGQEDGSDHLSEQGEFERQFQKTQGPKYGWNYIKL